MVKWTFAFRSVLALVISACIVLVCMGASVRGGAFGDAAPAAVIPASADVYVEINRGGTQRDTLTQLWQAYRSHPGTAAALAPLQSMIGQGGLQQAQTFLAQWATRAAVAAWLPSTPQAQPQVAIVAQLKPSSYMNGSNPLAGLAALTPATTYQGTMIVHVAFKDGTSGYGCIVSGDGVLTPDLATIKRVIDTATFHAPALMTNADFATTTAQLPLERALTVYVSSHAFASVPRLPATGVTIPQTQPALLKHPYALAMVAAPSGLEFVTSVVPVAGMSISPTPNEGAGVVGANAILYASMANVAGTLLASGVLSDKTLAQLQQQTGIDVRRDLLSWMTGETVLDVNTDVSPAVGALLSVAQSGNGTSTGLGLSSASPSLPGSIELAWNVADPAAVQQSLDRVAAGLARAAKASTSLLTTTTLPDGTVAHVVAGLPGLGYAFRGHWLILSTSLGADIAAASTPLSADPAYTTALASVPGNGPLVSVSYLDISRLLRVVDKWVAFTSKAGSSKGSGPARIAPTITMRRSLKTLAMPIHGITTAVRQAGAYGQQVARDVSASRLSRLSRSLLGIPMSRKLLSAVGGTWQQIEPLIAPVRSVVSATRQVGASGEQAYIFITIKP